MLSQRTDKQITQKKASEVNTRKGKERRGLHATCDPKESRERQKE